MDDVMDFLSEDPSAVHQPDVYGNTPLYYACLCGHIDICNLLLEKGCRDILKRGYMAALTEQIRSLLFRYHQVEWRKEEQDDDEDKWNEPLASSIWSNFTECMVAQSENALTSYELHDLQKKLHSLPSWVEIECQDGCIVGCFWNVLVFHWGWLLMHFMENAHEKNTPDAQSHNAASVSPPPSFTLSTIRTLTDRFKSIPSDTPVNILELISTYKPSVANLPRRIIISDVSLPVMSSLIQYMTINRMPHINVSAEENFENIDSLLYATHSFGMSSLMARILRMVSKKVDQEQMLQWKHYPSLKEANDIVNQISTASREELPIVVRSLVSQHRILSSNYFQNLCFVEGPSMFSTDHAREIRTEIVLYLLCDTKLTGAGSLAVYCHRSVITEKSPFFKMCLEGGFSESFKAEDGHTVSIPFPDVPDTILRQVSFWLFTNSGYNFTPENAVETLMLADRLQLSLLHQKAIAYLIKIEGECDPLGLLELSYLINNQQFKFQILQLLVKDTHSRHWGRIARTLRSKLSVQQLYDVRGLCQSTPGLCIPMNEAIEFCPECDEKVYSYTSPYIFSCCLQRVHIQCFNSSVHANRDLCPSCKENAWIDEQIQFVEPKDFDL